MVDRRATCIACLFGALTCVPAAASADDATSAKLATRAPEPQVEAELLEYLGSVDTEGQDWMEYLADTDILQVLEAARPPDVTAVDDQ